MRNYERAGHEGKRDQAARQAADGEDRQCAGGCLYRHALLRQRRGQPAGKEIVHDHRQEEDRPDQQARGPVSGRQQDGELLPYPLISAAGRGRARRGGRLFEIDAGKGPLHQSARPFGLLRKADQIMRRFRQREGAKQDDEQADACAEIKYGRPSELGAERPRYEAADAEEASGVVTVDDDVESYP